MVRKWNILFWTKKFIDRKMVRIHWPKNGQKKRKLAKNQKKSFWRDLNELRRFLNTFWKILTIFCKKSASRFFGLFFKSGQKIEIFILGQKKKWSEFWNLMIRRGLYMPLESLQPDLYIRSLTYHKVPEKTNFTAKKNSKNSGTFWYVGDFMIEKSSN